MKIRLIGRFVLVLSCGLVGCSSSDFFSAQSRHSPPDLFIHLFASYRYPKKPAITVSALLPHSGKFEISLPNGELFKGEIDPRDGKFFLQFIVRLCDGTNVFKGEAQLNERYDPGPIAYDAKTTFIYQPIFILSSNPNPLPILKLQAEAEREQWKTENPFKARQLAKIERKFLLLRPGLTKDEAFSLLGIYRYRNQLNDPRIFKSNDENLGFYQLAEKERLLFEFDGTGMKTTNVGNLFGLNFPVWDNEKNNKALRRIIRAELDTTGCASDGMLVWQTKLKWP